MRRSDQQPKLYFIAVNARGFDIAHWFVVVLGAGFTRFDQHSLVTVLIDTPTTRLIERMELPSTII
nr:hypothetical protein [Ascidiaceihabitans donghaensis]